MSLGKWKLSTETEWKDGGSVDLIEDTYLVQFSDVEGYIPPGQEIIELTVDKIIIGVYYQQLFDLIVTSSIDGWVDVYWKLSSDPTEYETLNSIKLPPGQYTIEFLNIDGYITPNPISINLIENTTVNGIYLENPQE